MAKLLFTSMIDPLLEGKHPLKGLYQGLDVAAMCMQEEADMRSIIGDVVTSLEYLDEKSSQDVPMKNLSIPKAEEGGFVAEASSEVGILSEAKGMDGCQELLTRDTGFRRNSENCITAFLIQAQ
ncbi:hypothetical protein Ddye_019637 [Dipteronia dyeriana]|uniref:Uncharacterized protein n=1 Tax=Dipteronia dyeriana TaxID=168575 RepID=A0AAD9TYR4_9ROSI|nr:hypothetical protein Ddye_019637 [Dipteronia dyeriana]